MGRRQCLLSFAKQGKATKARAVPTARAWTGTEDICCKREYVVVGMEEYGSSDGGRHHRPRSSHHEDTRLKKKIDVAGLDLLLLLDPRESYRVLGHDGMLLRMCDSRIAQVLVERRIIRGIASGAGVLNHLVLAPGRTAAQLVHVMRLKPRAVSICNRSTVVKVLPGTHTHRDSLAKGL